MATQQIDPVKLKIFEEILVTKLGLETSGDFTENLSQMLIEAGFGAESKPKPKNNYQVFYANRNAQLKKLSQEELKELGTRWGLEKITRQNIIVAEWHQLKLSSNAKASGI